MNRFASGMIAGGIIGAVGIAYALNDKKTRKHVLRGGKRMVSKANSLIDEIKDSVW